MKINNLRLGARLGLAVAIILAMLTIATILGISGMEEKGLILPAMGW